MVQTTTPEPVALLRPVQAARLLGVTVRTLANMGARGQLRMFVLPSGVRRYYESDVVAILATHTPGDRG